LTSRRGPSGAVRHRAGGSAGGDEQLLDRHLLVEGNPATDAELLKRVALRDGMITPGA